MGLPFVSQESQSLASLFAQLLGVVAGGQDSQRLSLHVWQAHGVYEPLDGPLARCTAVHQSLVLHMPLTDRFGHQGTYDERHHFVSLMDMI